MTSPSARWPVAIMAIVIVGLGVLFTPLKTPVASLGVLSLEFAGSAARTTEVIASWTPANQLRATAGFGLSFLFLVVLPLALAAGCRRSGTPAIARIASLQWLIPAAGAPENAMILHALIAGPSDLSMRIVAVLAAVKFAATLAGLAGSIAGWVTQPRSTAPTPAAR